MELVCLYARWQVHTLWCRVGVKKKRKRKLTFKLRTVNLQISTTYISASQPSRTHSNLHSLLPPKGCCYISQAFYPSPCPFFTLLFHYLSSFWYFSLFLQFLFYLLPSLMCFSPCKAPLGNQFALTCLLYYLLFLSYWVLHISSFSLSSFPFSCLSVLTSNLLSPSFLFSLRISPFLSHTPLPCFLVLFY